MKDINRKLSETKKKEVLENIFINKHIIMNELNAYKRINYNESNKEELKKLYGTVLGSINKEFFNSTFENLMPNLRQKGVSIPYNDITNLLDGDLLRWYGEIIKEYQSKIHCFLFYKVQEKDYIKEAINITRENARKFYKTYGLNPYGALLINLYQNKNDILLKENILLKEKLEKKEENLKKNKDQIKELNSNKEMYKRVKKYLDKQYKLSNEKIKEKPSIQKDILDELRDKISFILYEFSVDLRELGIKESQKNVDIIYKNVFNKTFNCNIDLLEEEFKEKPIIEYMDYDNLTSLYINLKIVLNEIVLEKGNISLNETQELINSCIDFDKDSNITEKLEYKIKRERK